MPMPPLISDCPRRQGFPYYKLREEKDMMQMGTASRGLIVVSPKGWYPPRRQMGYFLSLPVRESSLDDGGEHLKL